MCSGIYVEWNKKKNIAVQDVNSFKMISGVRGVWQSTIILDHNPLGSVKANLITCAVNEDPRKPQFYVALDNETLGGAYVLETKQKYKFSLVMHVTGVIALKQKE